MCLISLGNDGYAKECNSSYFHQRYLDCFVDCSMRIFPFGEIYASPNTQPIKIFLCRSLIASFKFFLARSIVGTSKLPTGLPIIILIISRFPRYEPDFTSRLLLKAPKLFKARADDNHAAPAYTVLVRRATFPSTRQRTFQALVRFLAYYRIKPHVPPLVRVPVYSFEF